MEYWHSHWDPEGRKQDPYGMGIDISEDNLGCETEEALVQMNGAPSKGAATQKGEPNTVRAE